MSNEECRLPLACYNINILQFTEFIYNSVNYPPVILNSDRDYPAIALL